MKARPPWFAAVGGPNNPVNTLCVLPDFVFGPYKYLPAFVGAAYHAARPLRAFPTLSKYLPITCWWKKVGILTNTVLAVPV